MAFCVSCGHKLPEGSRYCAECGEPVTRDQKQNNSNAHFHIISLNCPHCKAPLQVDAKLSRAVCGFCGNSFVLEDEVEKEREAGMAYERGRMEASNAAAVEAAGKIAALKKPVAELNALSKKQKALDFQIRQKRVRIKDLEKITIRVVLWLAGGLCMFFAILSMIFGGSGIGGFLVGALLLGIAVLASYLWKKYSARAVDKIEHEVQDMERKYQTGKARMDRIIAENDIDYIPEVYRTRDAMEYLYSMLSMGRATSLQQAITLYEEELHRRNMSEMQQEQIRLQQLQIEAQKEQTKALKKQQKQLRELEENWKEEEAHNLISGIIGTAVTTGIGIAIGKGIKKFFD